MLHPEWSYQAVIYEMNVRQLTREGTLRAAAAKLGFLRDMGIDAIRSVPRGARARWALTIRSATIAPSTPGWGRWGISMRLSPRRTAWA